MITVENALALVLAEVRDFGTELVPLEQSLGRTLADVVVADSDFPPFNRVMMDGVAIDHKSFERGQRAFDIAGVQAAGAPQQTLFQPDLCIEVMTGAIVPFHATAVVPYEQLTIVDGVANIDASAVQYFQNIHLQGVDGRKNGILVNKYERITPAVMAIMASVGMAQVPVFRLPAIAVCSSGNELVPVSAQPELHQVRRSNVYALAGALRGEGITVPLFHLPDEPGLMEDGIAAMMSKFDVLMFSGAVSKGKFDYLPQVLEKLGMEQVFHSVAQRPGKPFLFGRFVGGPLVFGFPGNPVSTFVCYHIFCKPWLLSSLHSSTGPTYAALASAVNFSPALTYHLLVSVAQQGNQLVGTPIYSSTSGDQLAMVRANAIMILPADRTTFHAGEIFPISYIS